MTLMIFFTEIHDDVFKFFQFCIKKICLLLHILLSLRIYGISLILILQFHHAHAGALKKLISKEQENKLIQFLMGLTDSYKTARGQILLMGPLPTVNKAYSLMLQEENHMQMTRVSSIPEATTLVVNKYQPS